MAGNIRKTGAFSISAERIAETIHFLRGYKVMLDADLASLYGVQTRVLNQAIRRNRDRFPADFMFQLTPKEAVFLRSQIVILKAGSGRHKKYPPYAFTEHGVAMLSSVLKSDRAARVNIEIMRAFVRLRRVLESNEELARKLVALESKYDGQFAEVFEAIRLLIRPEIPPKGRIGFS